MNERIKLLAEQAELNATLLFNKDKLEKFAELIVRECIQSIQNESMDSGDEWEDGLQIAEGAVREHFGVEE